MTTYVRDLEARLAEQGFHMTAAQACDITEAVCQIYADLLEQQEPQATRTIHWLRMVADTMPVRDE
jgi:hypothetical protein